MSFLGKEGFFFFSSWLDSGSLIERLVGYKALKPENTVLVCRCVQTSSQLFRGHFYILGGFIFLLLFMLLLTWQKNIINYVFAGNNIENSEMFGKEGIWKSRYPTDFPRGWGLAALIVEPWRQGLSQRLVKGVSLWGSCGGQGSGRAGLASRVCAQQPPRAPCCEIHSITTLEFLSLE